MGEKIKILYRIYLLGVCFIGALGLLFFQMFRMQISEQVTDTYQAIKHTRIPSLRGNIYSANGDLLVSSVVKYELRFDPITVPEYLFNDNIEILADSLANVFTKSKSDYLKELKVAKKKGNRYFLIGKELSYMTLQKIKEFPIFNLGLNKGGLIVIPNITREYPWGNMAYRTLGYEREGSNGNNLSVGIEGAYGHYLRGTDGFQLRQKIGKNQWKPIAANSNIEPVEGQDIYTTLDPFIQEVTHQKLLQQLKAFDAAHGVAVVMETNSGKIKAISNLSKHGKNYEERYNYAVGQLQEPGSTFKLMSYVALMEDGFISPHSKISTQGGTYDIQGFTVRDSRAGGYGVINASEAFALSSNVAIAKFTERAYGKNPMGFLNRLNLMGVNKELGIMIKGEPTPKVPHPGDPNWSKISLPWMSYGYGLLMTPLQILTFYNAIANDGKMLKPKFVEKIVSSDGTVKMIPTDVLNPSFCSQKTLKAIKKMMRRVVTEGTAKNINLSYLPIAGKTGTTQSDYWKSEGGMGYVASFVGYFPADNPKYTCIVSIAEPNKDKGYYGSTVAAPVFQQIAKMVYPNTPSRDSLNINTWEQAVAKRYNRMPKVTKGIMPNVIGLSIMDALSLLENMGVSVRFNGSGKVENQSVKKGTRLNKTTTVYLNLS